MMCDGRMRAVGSPGFLKDAFNVGYHLRVSKSSGFDERKFEQHLKSQLSPDCSLERWNQAQALYQIPGTLEEEELATFFAKFSQQKKLLNIKSYGLTATPMENVFEAFEKKMRGIKSTSNNIATAMPKGIPLERRIDRWTQFRGLFYKVSWLSGSSLCNMILVLDVQLSHLCV